MRAFKLSTIAVIAIFAIAIPLGILTFADDPPPTQITTSSGSRHMVESFSDAETKWGNAETRINKEISDGIKLNNQANFLEKGVNRDKAGLSSFINVGTTITAKKLFQSV